MKNSLLFRVHSILIAAAFCFSTSVSAKSEANELSFEWEIIQKSSCESNNGIVRLNIIGGSAPYKIVIDEYSHIYSRYANTAAIKNSLFYNEADEHLVNDVYFQNEIIVSQLPAGVKVFSVTDVYGGEVTNMIDIPSTVMEVSILETNENKSLEAHFESLIIENDKYVNLDDASFFVELDRLDSVGNYTVSELYDINKAKSLEELMNVLNENPDLNTYHRNKEEKVLRLHLPYKELASKHVLLKNLEKDKTYILKIYPDEYIAGYSGVCMSYTYVFNTNTKQFKTGQSSIVSTK